MNDFTVDVSFDAAWLEQALATARAGKVVRMSVVIKDAGPQAKYAARCLGGGDHEYLVAAIAGDFTKDAAWLGA